MGLRYKICAWVAVSYLLFWVGQYNMCKLWVTLSGLYLVFTNLGKLKPGERSAYSLFNPNNEKLPGTFGTEHMEVGGLSRLHSRRGPSEPEADRLEEEYRAHPSKMGNRLCYCGSGLKYKKCCMGQLKKE